MGGGGKLGCGSLIIALIGALVFGIDPAQMLGGLEQVQGPAQDARPGGGTNVEESCRTDASSLQMCNALSSLNKTWQPVFAAANVRFQPPKLVFYSQMGRSGCGAAQSAMGPFYCPSDRGIYLDTVIGAGSYLGPRSIIMPGVTVGRGCVILPGALVTRDVPDHATVSGNPGKVLEKAQPERHFRC